MATLRICDYDSGVLAVDLRHLIDLLLPRSFQATWTVSPVKLFCSELNSFEEYFEAIEQEGDRLELLARNRSTVSGIVLAELAQASKQVIWGEFVAILPQQDSAWVAVRAIDSTFYEVTTMDPTVLNKIKSKFKDVRVAVGPAVATPISQVPRDERRMRILSMTYAPKIVLQLPLSDPDLLEPFVEACLRDGVTLIAIVGEGASKMDDLIDELVVGDGSDTGRFINTTFHPNETVEEVMEFALSWEEERGQSVVLVKL